MRIGDRAEAVDQYSQLLQSGILGDQDGADAIAQVAELLRKRRLGQPAEVDAELAIELGEARVDEGVLQFRPVQSDAEGFEQAQLEGRRAALQEEAGGALLQQIVDRHFQGSRDEVPFVAVRELLEALPGDPGAPGDSGPASGLRLRNAELGAPAHHNPVKRVLHLRSVREPPSQDKRRFVTAVQMAELATLDLQPAST